LENEQPDRVRVTQVDGSTVELASPEVRADSLMGATVGDSATTVSVPLSQVQSVKVKRFDAGRSLGLVLIGGLGLLLAMAVAIALDPIGVG